jgi:GST-like protein
VGRWVSEIDARPATHRGRFVNKPDGVRERHSAEDFAVLEQGDRPSV